MRTNETHYLGVGDFFASVGRNVFKVDDIKSVSAFDTFANAVGSNPDALTQATHFVGVRFIPNGREARMIVKLPILKELSSFGTQNRQSPLSKECRGEFALS